LKQTGLGDPWEIHEPVKLKHSYLLFIFLLRNKQKIADSELACEQAHQYLLTKAKKQMGRLV
jgi:hypothetical protein